MTGVRWRTIAALGPMFCWILTCCTVARAELYVTAQMIGCRSNAPYAYGQIEVRNNSDQEASFRIRIGSYFYNQQMTIIGQTLGPRQTRVYHVPLFSNAYGQWEVVTNDSQGRQAGTHLGDEEKHFLNIAGMRQWATVTELQDFGSSYAPAHAPAPYGTYTPVSPDCVAQLEPDNLPDNWLCYTSFHAVFVHEPAWQSIAPPERKALTQWVQAGGRLVVYGAQQEKSVPAMLGAIDYVVANPIKEKRLEKDWQATKVTPKFVTHASWSSGVFPFVTKKWSGRVGGFLIATLFFVVAGPVNYWYFARRDRVRWLLTSLPAASIACCLLITGYFLATQGFAKRGGSLAVILLDEESDSALTLGRHVFYSGLYPLGGFSFARDAAFFPLGTGDRQDPYTIDLSQGQRLQSGIFSPSTNFHYATVRPWTTRAKLVWDLEEMSVINGFDADATRVMIQVGQKYYEARDVARGGKAMLTEATKTTDKSGGLADPLFYSGLENEVFLKQYTRDALSDFAADGSAVRYVVLFVSPPVDLDAGVNTAGNNKVAVLVGKSLLPVPTAP